MQHGKYNGGDPMEKMFDHFQVAGDRGHETWSPMKVVKDEMDRMNEIELEWIQQYQAGPDEERVSDRVWEEIHQESEQRLESFVQTLDVEDGGELIHQTKVHHVLDGYSDGGLGAANTVYLGVAVTTIICLAVLCALARCLKARQGASFGDSDSYGTVDGYIL